MMLVLKILSFYINLPECGMVQSKRILSIYLSTFMKKKVNLLIIIEKNDKKLCTNHV